MIMKFAVGEEEAKLESNIYQNIEINAQDKELLDEELGDSDEESLCTESSWDPDEDDERELEDVLMNEADLRKKSMLSSEIIKRKREKEEDIYGNEEGPSKHHLSHDSPGTYKPIEEDDLSELSNQEEEIEYDKYQMTVKKHEQKRLEAIKKLEEQQKATKTQEEGPQRKVIKIGGKPKRKYNSIREMQERAIFDKLKEKGASEYSKFDLTLSGCSGTIMIQTPAKIFIGWVGDCHAVLCKKERKLVAVKLTQQSIEHTPAN